MFRRFPVLAGTCRSLRAEGQSDAEAKANPPLNLEEIRPRYFSTLRVPLMRGPAFTVADSATALPVANHQRGCRRSHVAWHRPDWPPPEDGDAGVAGSG